MGFKAPEEFRIDAEGCAQRRWPREMGTTHEAGANGVFVIPTRVQGRKLKVIASDGLGWEHVSISILINKRRARTAGRRGKTPTWQECCQVKDLFWGPEDVVMQLHPRHSEYVSVHECLHLWRPTPPGIEIPIGSTHFTIPAPPSFMVGPVTGPKV